MSRKQLDVGAFCRIAVAALMLGGCSQPPTPTPRTSAQPTDTPSTAPSQSPSADTLRDVGIGRPGESCLAQQLGKSFTRDGVTYVCRSPKPYRWRPAL